MIGRVIVLVSGLATAAGTGAQALAPYRVDGELYVAWRAEGLAIETPGVRR